MALFTTPLMKEPTNYEEALNCKEKEDQIAWKEGIDKEINEMTKRGVWEVIDEKEIPSDKQCIKNKWIFMMKQN
jgi:hypothetical protein